MSKPKLVTAAVLTIKGAAKMTPAGRKLLAAWLRDRAKLLIQNGDEFAPTFTSRYFYYPGK